MFRLEHLNQLVIENNLDGIKQVITEEKRKRNSSYLWTKEELVNDAIVCAISVGKIEVVKLFLEEGFYPSGTLRKIETVNNTEIYTYHTLIYRAAITGNLDMVKALVECGAKIKPPRFHDDFEGDNSGIIGAIESNQTHIVEYLLSQDAAGWGTCYGFWYKRHLDGVTFLELSVINKNKKIFDMLIQHDSSVSAAIESAHAKVKDYFATTKIRDVYPEFIKTILEYAATLPEKTDFKNLKFLKNINCKDLNLSGITLKGKVVTEEIIKKCNENNWNEEIESESESEDALVTSPSLDPEPCKLNNPLPVEETKYVIHDFNKLTTKQINQIIIDNIKSNRPVDEVKPIEKLDAKLIMEIINLKPDNEIPPLILAAMKNKTTMLQWLLQIGANPNINKEGCIVDKMSDEETALFAAAYNANIIAINALIAAGANIDYRRSILDVEALPIQEAIAAGFRDSNWMPWLMLYPPKNKPWFPTWEDSYSAAKLLIPNFNLLSSRHINQIYRGLLAVGYSDIIKILFDNKLVDPNNVPIQYMDDETNPLVIAVTHGNKEIVSMLLDAGANPNVRNKEGMPIFHIAADKNTKNNIEILKLLLQKVPNPSMRDQYGRNLESAAIGSGIPKIVELVKESVRQDELKQRKDSMDIIQSRDSYGLFTPSKNSPAEYDNEQDKPLSKNYCLIL